jgi:hypothetical protein
MKVTYAISFEDYRTFQPPFVARPGHNAGFQAVLLVCSLMVSLGVYCIVQGLGISTGGFLIGLGVCSAALAYVFDKGSVSKTRERYDRNLADAYQRIHCRDHRTLEVDQDGFTASCKCGTVTRPWTELARFSENKSLFFVGTKTDAQLVPKAAFSSEGAITEFRTLFVERLNADRPITSRSIEFSYTPQDFRNARILHILNGGGWRSLVGKLATFCISAYGVYAIWGYMSPQRNPALLFGLIGGLLAVPLLRGMRSRRRHYLGRQRIYFSEQGLHLEGSGTVARNTWTQFIGYLESKHAVLLYYHPRAYRIIPRRALADRETEFRALLEEKLSRYDYRRSAAAPTKPQVQSQSSVSK